MRRTLLTGIVGALAFASATSAGATAGLGASDTAVPNYLSSTSDTAGANEFKCVGGQCSMVIKTKTTPYPCTSELIVLSGLTTPGLLYQNTYCAVSISGSFEASLGEISPTCVLDAVQALQVSFSSGANSAFNGTFPASATFKPTAVSTNGYITRARISVKGGGPIDGNPAATGEVAATFEVLFSGSGLSPYCYSASASGLTTLTPGFVVTRF